MAQGLKPMKFHSANCLLTALNNVKAEIIALKQADPDAEYSLETLNSVRSPSIMITVTHGEMGDIEIPAVQCSNPACDQKTNHQAGLSGWWIVKQK